MKCFRVRDPLAHGPRNLPFDTGSEEETGVGLLVLDLQPALLATVSHRERLLKRCQFIVRAAQLLKIPVWLTEQVPEKLGQTVDSVRDLITRPAEHIFAKTTFSALEDPLLEASLRETGVQHLFLCGIETPVCVYLTAVSAMRKGFDVTLFHDAVAARREDDAECALHALTLNGAHVLPSETVFYSLLGDANQPEFKTFTQLVKDAGTPRL